MISQFQVTLLWQRAIGDPGFKRIFCLLHAEKLSYQVCDQALLSLMELSHGRKKSENNNILSPSSCLGDKSPPSLRHPPSFFSLLFLSPFSLPFFSPFLLFHPLLPLFLPLLPPQSSKTDYRLAIICSNEDEDKSHIISQLSHYKKHFTGLHDVKKYQEYLKSNFIGTMPLQFQSVKFAAQGIQASIVDSE